MGAGLSDDRPVISGQRSRRVAPRPGAGIRRSVHHELEAVRRDVSGGYVDHRVPTELGPDLDATSLGLVNCPANRNAVWRSEDSRSNGSGADVASRGMTTRYQRGAALAAV